MTGDYLLQELRAVISSRAPFDEIVTTLEEFRRLGVSRHDVQIALGTLRHDVQDEATEDRILEVLDIVTGFCSVQNTVWED